MMLVNLQRTQGEIGMFAICICTEWILALKETDNSVLERPR
jgi:hypothetical protein